MTFSLAAVQGLIDALRPFDGADLASVAAPELLQLQRRAGEFKRGADVLVASVAGEVARRSAPEDGRGGLARQQGYRSPQQLVADSLGGSTGEADRLMKVGRALSRVEDATLVPQVDAPSPHPLLAAEIRDGRLSVDKAAVIAGTLDGLIGDVGKLEEELVAAGLRLGLAQLRRVCMHAAARHDHAGLVEREKRMRAERTVDFYEDASGMIEVRARLDPLTAAPFVTWLDAQVKSAFQAKHDGGVENRTAGQIRADALAMLFQHGLDCDQPTSGVKTTVIVRMSVESLRSGVGVGECDSLGMPISASTLRRMAVDAEVLPVVMGGKSEVLDWGRAERLFSRSQRLALAERDGGCSWCHAPPSWCAAHHISWWSKGGRSDLSNGVLLCTRCHHRVHDDGWEVAVRDGTVWFTPPAHVDRQRTPRMGGRARLGLAV